MKFCFVKFVKIFPRQTFVPYSMPPYVHPVSVMSKMLFSISYVVLSISKHFAIMIVALKIS